MEANLDTSLQLVYNHIATVSGLSTFTLVGGYPPKPLNMSSTVEASDLADGTLIQKWSNYLVLNNPYIYIKDYNTKNIWNYQL